VEGSGRGAWNLGKPRKTYQDRRSQGLDSNPEPPNTKYRTISLPVVLYGCYIWSLTLREEHGLWYFGTVC
jgi:hypothetical protein